MKKIIKIKIDKSLRKIIREVELELSDHKKILGPFKNTESLKKSLRS